MQINGYHARKVGELISGYLASSALKVGFAAARVQATCKYTTLQSITFLRLNETSQICSFYVAMCSFIL